MPLHNFAKLLSRGRREHFALPLFDAFDSDSVDAILEAAEASRAPVILGIYDMAMQKQNAAALCAYAREAASAASVPIALMLDHGRDLEQVKRAIGYGFTGVMIDGSSLPIEENIAATKEAVGLARDAGVFVEGELGIIGTGSEYDDPGREAGLTVPEDAKRFAEETGVDLLAVAIGTAHGQYKGEPRLDLQRLEEIAALVATPLALHGGTGLSETQFRDAIARGAAKVNVATDLYVTAGAQMAEAGAQMSASPSYWGIHKAAVSAIRERCSYYIDLFGAAGKAE